MDQKLYSVRIGHDTFSPSTQQTTDRSRLAFWQAKLRSAHQLGLAARCMCNGSGDRFLCVRRTEGKLGDDFFSLAKYPDSGHEHAPDCMHHSLSRLTSGLHSYSPLAFEERASGIRVRIEASEHPTQGPAATATQGLPHFSLKGVLHLLWASARLNFWHPAMSGRRSWAVCAASVLKSSSHISVRKAKVSDSLIIEPVFKNKSIPNHNKDVLDNCLKKAAPLMLLGCLNPDKHPDKNAGTFPKGIPTKGWEGLPFISTSHSFWISFQKTHPLEWAHWSSGKRVVFLASIAPPKIGRAWALLDIVFFASTDNFIPVFSTAEAHHASCIFKQDAMYERIMTYDAPDATKLPLLIEYGDSAPTLVFGSSVDSGLSKDEMDRHMKRFGSGFQYRVAIMPVAQNQAPSSRPDPDDCFL